VGSHFHFKKSLKRAEIEVKNASRTDGLPMQKVNPDQ
jgi:hypothetical protein